MRRLKKLLAIALLAGAVCLGSTAALAQGNVESPSVKSTTVKLDGSVESPSYLDGNVESPSLTVSLLIYLSAIL